MDRKMSAFNDVSDAFDLLPNAKNLPASEESLEQSKVSLAILAKAILKIGGPHGSTALNCKSGDNRRWICTQLQSKGYKAEVVSDQREGDFYQVIW